MLDILWIFIIFMVINNIANLFKRSIKHSKSINKDNDISRGNKEVNEEEIQKYEEIEMVMDSCCNMYIAKNKAYQLATDNNIHYFCSWDCRQKFIEDNKK